MTDVAFELITSTDFSEYFPNFFAGQIDGRYFGAHFRPEEKQLYITMGVSAITASAKEDLLARVRASSVMNEETMHFEDHSVCGRVPVFDSEWLGRVKEALALFGNWASANQIMSGCFLCGKDDLTVLYRNDDIHNAYICDSCLESPPDQLKKEIEQMLVEARAPIVIENRWRGILLTFLARAVISMIWIPVMMFVLDSRLAIIVPLAGSAVIALIAYLLYRKFSGAFSSLGKWIVTGFLVGFCFLEYFIAASSVISQHVNRLFPNVSLNSLDVLLYLSDYLSSPGLNGGLILANFIVFPLIGLAFVAGAQALFAAFERPQHDISQ